MEDLPPHLSGAVFALVITATALYIASAVAATAIVDLNGNGYGDIWEQKHKASGLPPTGDRDGDGNSNWTEFVAGTDPFDALSLMSVRKIQAGALADAVVHGGSGAGQGIVLTIASQAGKAYWIEGLSSLGGVAWKPVSGRMLAKGASLLAECS